MKQQITLLILAILILLPFWAVAQPGLPGDPQQSPLGGLEWLAIAGGAYAFKKLRDKKQ